MLLDDEPEAVSRPWLKPVLQVGGGLLLAGAVTALVMGMLQESGPRRKQSVQQISLVRPPPPPPPPKVEEKLPEPEVKQEEVKVPEQQPDPTPQAEAPPPGEQLGVDAQGAGSGDGFGLVGRPGGRDITTIGGGGDRHAWYAGLLRGQLQKVLARDARLRGSKFQVAVRVWVDEAGAVRRSEIFESSGNAKTDESITLALANVPVLRETPPGDLPQPIRFRLTSTF